MVASITKHCKIDYQIGNCYNSIATNENKQENCFVTQKLKWVLERKQRRQQPFLNKNIKFKEASFNCKMHINFLKVSAQNIYEK